MFNNVSKLGLETDELKWSDLTPEEQSSLLRQGYKPQLGTIIHGNIDLELTDANGNN